MKAITSLKAFLLLTFFLQPASADDGDDQFYRAVFGDTGKGQVFKWGNYIDYQIIGGAKDNRKKAEDLTIAMMVHSKIPLNFSLDRPNLLVVFHSNADVTGYDEGVTLLIEKTHLSDPVVKDVRNQILEGEHSCILTRANDSDGKGFAAILINENQPEEGIVTCLKMNLMGAFGFSSYKPSEVQTASFTDNEIAFIKRLYKNHSNFYIKK